MSWKQFFRTFFRTLFLILLLIAAVLVLLSMAGVINLDVYLRRYASSHGVQERTDSFAVTIGEDTAVGCTDHALLLVSQSGAALYKADGSVADGLSAGFSSPVVHCCGEYSVAYDAGGTAAAVFSADGRAYEITAENTVISASVNAQGRTALCTKESRYLGSVTVYSAQGDPIYKIYSAEAYPLAAQVSPKEDCLAVLRVNEEGSCVDIYDMHATDAAAAFSVPGAVIADIAWLSPRRILLVGTEAMYIIDSSGEQIGVLEFTDSPLCAWAFSDDFITVVTADSRLSPVRTLMTLDTDGRIIASADFGGGIDSISQCGNYLAVIAGGDLTIYNRELKNCDSFPLDGGTGRAWMRADGTAAVVGNNTVSIFG